MYHFLLCPVDEQILSLQQSTAMLKSLIGKVIAVLNEGIPLGKDDHHYCKLICKADSVFLNKVSNFLQPKIFLLFYIIRLLMTSTSFFFISLFIKLKVHT